MKENEASATAYAVMQGLLYIGKQNLYPGLVAAETIAAGTGILERSEEGRRRLKQLTSPVFRAMVPLMEFFMVPGLTLHYALRKRYIEACVRQAIEAGYTQCVNLGAGFDVLAWRLHKEHPEVNFIEIDHPATSAEKTPALEAMGIGENLKFLDVDFTTQTLLDRVGSMAEFQADRQTVFVCEGVISYLTEEEAGVLLKTLTNLCSAPTRLICTCVVEPSSPENNIGPFLDLYLAIKGESLKWRINPAEVTKFFSQNGFYVAEIASPQDMKSRFIAGALKGKLHLAEYSLVADAESRG